MFVTGNKRSSVVEKGDAAEYKGLTDAQQQRGSRNPFPSLKSLGPWQEYTQELDVL